jgi:hypothetical protein
VLAAVPLRYPKFHASWILQDLFAVGEMKMITPARALYLGRIGGDVMAPRLPI